MTDVCPQLHRIRSSLARQRRQYCVLSRSIVYRLHVVLRACSLVRDKRERACEQGWEMLSVCQEVAERRLNIRIWWCLAHSAEVGRSLMDMQRSGGHNVFRVLVQRWRRCSQTFRLAAGHGVRFVRMDGLMTINGPHCHRVLVLLTPSKGAM